MSLSACLISKYAIWDTLKGFGDQVASIDERKKVNSMKKFKKLQRFEWVDDSHIKPVETKSDLGLYAFEYMDDGVDVFCVISVDVLVNDGMSFSVYILTPSAHKDDSVKRVNPHFSGDVIADICSFKLPQEIILCGEKDIKNLKNHLSKTLKFKNDLMKNLNNNVWLECPKAVLSCCPTKSGKKFKGIR